MHIWYELTGLSSTICVTDMWPASLEGHPRRPSTLSGRCFPSLLSPIALWALDLSLFSQHLSTWLFATSSHRTSSQPLTIHCTLNHQYMALGPLHGLDRLKLHYQLTWLLRRTSRYCAFFVMQAFMFLSRIMGRTSKSCLFVVVIWETLYAEYHQLLHRSGSNSCHGRCHITIIMLLL